MLKFALVSGLMMVSTVSALACEGEAQFIAKVDKAQYLDGVGCKVTLKEVTQYSANQTCPLDLVDVNALGVLVKANSSKVCASFKGLELSGVIEKQGDVLVLN